MFTMKKKSLVLIVLFFAVLILSPLVHSKNDGSQEVILNDDEKAFTDSFKWDSGGVKLLAIHSLKIIPENHRKVAMESLKAVLEKNAANASDGKVTREVFSDTLWEVVPPEIQVRVFHRLTDGK